ncbi:MAG: DUF1553 domain-containing protein [Pirellulales bacterium]
MPRFVVGLCLAVLLLADVVRAADSSVPPANPAPATAVPSPELPALVELRIDAGLGAGTIPALRGGDARQQLVVTGRDAAGGERDLTGDVQYSAEPVDVVEISPAGLVRPLREGEAKVRVIGPQGLTAEAVLNVTNIAHELQINFPNQIVPIFTKLGCNGGGCHGKASGQNGFKLSLLGFEPTEDYEHLVKEGRGRRLFPAAPDRSLLITKGAGILPHGGGPRLERDSTSYALLRRWIAQGMPYGKADDPTLSRIEIFPQQRTMQKDSRQQLAVVAHYSDGSTEDVTLSVQFESNDPELAQCSATGLVKTGSQTGGAAIMARYQGKVAVFRASVPLGAPVENLPPAKNFIDELVFARLKQLGLPPSAVCDDATFVRRAFLDVCGRLPTPAEVQTFVDDAATDKRDRLIDRLLESSEYADFFAAKWNAVLRNRRQDDNFKRGSIALHAWIRESLYHNKPFDQFVGELLASSGEATSNPPVVWYRQVRESHEQVEDAAQLFLGMRLQCARCHHHPFEKWSQQDYYGLAAFFSRVGRKPGSRPGEERIVHQRGEASATHPKTGKPIKPAPLDGAPLELTSDDDPRQALADWLAQPDNPFFAPALVNRYWKHFFGRALVEPEDDMRVTNPATNPELIDALAKHFVAHKFDLKDLVRTICTSQTYALSSEPNEFNQADKQSYSRYYPKRLPAEVLLDALDQVTGGATAFGGMPAGTRALQLPSANQDSYFLTVFGRPEGATACECERSNEANLAQSLHLLNSDEVQNKLSSGSGRAAVLAQDKNRPAADKIRELYQYAYGRVPTADEQTVATAHVEKAAGGQQAYEDIVWALVNTKEFLFNH